MSSFSLRRILRLALSGRVIRFIGVGVLATATDFLVFNLAMFGMDDPSRPQVVLANTSAFACATVVGYLLNARLTFRAPADRGSLARYLIVAIIGAAIYDGALLSLMYATDASSLTALNLLKIVAISLSATWNFCGFALFAFRERPEWAAAQQEARL